MLQAITSTMLVLTLCASSLAGPAKPNPHSEAALSKYSKDVLVTLCHNLYQKLDQVTETIDSIRASHQDPQILQKKIAQLQRQVSSLTDKNKSLTQRLTQKERAHAALLKMLKNKGPGKASKTTGKGYVPPYRYTYNIQLIGSNHTDYVTIQYSDGKTASTQYNRSNFDPSHVLFHGYFRNNGKKAYRFQFEIRIAKPQLQMGFKSGPPPIIGSAIYKTGVLEPGEIAEISKIIKVPNPYNIGRAAIGNVQAWPAKK